MNELDLPPRARLVVDLPDLQAVTRKTFAGECAGRQHLRRRRHPAFGQHAVVAAGGIADGRGLAAVAGYPHLTVPMGSVKGLPVGLSFIGPKWSDASILALGYDYEQASRKIMTPALLPSIEESPQIAPHLKPRSAAR